MGGLLLGISQNDAETRIALQRHQVQETASLPGTMTFTKPDMHSLDADVPGSERRAKLKDLVGQPESSEIVLHLLAKDKGWLAAYLMFRHHKPRHAEPSH